ncbi:hypothetical protein [Endozoicomonas arenosclerae]|uniref:hypothetical protein n=1 Tax=Endozoicomonas arenosclerae TaxID=1633495 RepID=UPI000783D1E6|nr:hypothetical protein [Endozoicomonas arenosclerae]
MLLTPILSISHDFTKEDFHTDYLEPTTDFSDLSETEESDDLEWNLHEQLQISHTRSVCIGKFLTLSESSTVIENRQFNILCQSIRKYANNFVTGFKQSTHQCEPTEDTLYIISQQMNGLTEIVIFFQEHLAELNIPALLNLTSHPIDRSMTSDFLHAVTSFVAKRGSVGDKKLGNLFLEHYEKTDARLDGDEVIIPDDEFISPVDARVIKVCTDNIKTKRLEAALQATYQYLESI